MKIILGGNSGVGKTTFAKRLTTGEYTENISTIGVEVRQKGNLGCCRTRRI